MPQLIVSFPESTSRSKSKTVSIPNLKSITSVTVNTGNVTHSVSGENVTINVSNGTSTRQESWSEPGYYEYTTKSSSSTTFNYCNTTQSYNDGYWSGTLSLVSETPGSNNTVSCSYSGQVSHYVSGASGTTYYYAYTVTINYEEYQAPTNPTVTYPSSSGVIISTSPTNITWTAASDAETPTNQLKYNIEVSTDNGLNWASIVALTNAGVTSYSYNFLQHSDTTQAKIRIRTYDGMSYSTWNVSPTFSITHKIRKGTIKFNTATGLVTIPLYDTSVGMDGKNQLRVQTSSGIACFELVSTSDVNASPLRVKTSSGIKAIGK